MRARKLKKSDLAVVEATWKAIAHAEGWDRTFPKALSACVMADLGNEPTMMTYYREQLTKESEKWRGDLSPVFRSHPALSDVKPPDEVDLVDGKLVPKIPNFVPVKVGWKDEGDEGPVFLENAAGDYATGAEWIPKATARAIAKKMNLPFEEF